ncbi:hypothetical protein EJ07DRAFT_180294 [Lizonia empirigonia]|nr:hypothetical protein EJ07DRAFT_180294 [Lizonia empirigonia]
MTDDTGTTCAVCSKPTTNKCLGCRTQSICKEAQLEKTLARVAEVVHEAYLTFRENTWGFPIIRVDDKEDALIIYTGSPWDNPQWFREFPHAVVPPNRRAKLGVLTAWTCDEPYAFLHTLIVKLLQGLSIDTQEISVLLRQIPRKTVAIHMTTLQPQSNWPAYQHKVLRLTSRKSRAQWVMDFAGGQYGIEQALHTWAHYKAAFVDKIVGVYHVGAHKCIVDEIGKMAGLPSLSHGLVGKAAAELDKALSTWESEHHPLSAMGGLADAEFARQKTSLLRVLSDAVRTFIATSDFTAEVRSAKACNSLVVGEMLKAKTMQMDRALNLMEQPQSVEPGLTDFRRDRFGPGYVYKEGDEYLPGANAVVIEPRGGKSTGTVHVVL